MVLAARQRCRVGVKQALHAFIKSFSLLLSFLFQCFAAFSVGSMIYSGLEFGQYFELERDTKCHNVLLALTPATRMAFIFIQMYFIFLNDEVRTIVNYLKKVFTNS